jgi:hypothetical protein
VRADRLARTRRLAVAAAALLALAALVVVLLRGGEDAPPAGRAAELMPASAYVFAQLSTDGDRDATARAAQLAGRFPGWPALRDEVVRRLSVGGRASADELEGWLGDEAAFGLIDLGLPQAGSLVLVAVTDEQAAGEFVARGARQEQRGEYRGVAVRRFGELFTATSGGFLAIGQLRTVQAAIDLGQGRGRSLASSPTYREAMQGAPADRVADGYVSPAGVRRLLLPAGGTLALAGGLLDEPGLRGAGLSLTAGDDRAALRVRTLRARRAPGPAFTPALPADVPRGAFAYLGSRGLSEIAGRFLATAGTTGRDLRRQLERARPLLEQLRGEVAVAFTPAAPAPLVSIITRVQDEAEARRALRSLGDRGLRGAVFDGKLVLSTTDAGLRAARDPQGGIVGAEGWSAVQEDRPAQVSSLVFIAFDQLLRLAEQTGLNDSSTYVRVRGDLEKVRAAGASTTTEETASTAEITLSIP